MPRVQENAPGILPSRSISRGSRISTMTTFGSCAALMASLALTVSIAALASSIRALMPVWMVWGICLPLLRATTAGVSRTRCSVQRCAGTHIAARWAPALQHTASRCAASGARDALPHQFLHRAFEALDRDRIHALRQQTTDDGGGFRIVPVLLRHRIEPHGMRIGAR